MCSTDCLYSVMTKLIKCSTDKQFVLDIRHSLSCLYAIDQLLNIGSENKMFNSTLVD